MKIPAQAQTFGYYIALANPGGQLFTERSGVHSVGTVRLRRPRRSAAQCEA